ncbi:DUF4444 domain-containing protein [Marimonas sp. MJW-29]|uniref:DUF4444 domain-containing protein n=1 Tax=Sulfitobacter sediminis TaxID=3234186 RepID=A0ABV3RJP2_9RHOB
MTEPTFPPLMSGLAVTGSADPFETACNRAIVGCDAGLVVYNTAADRLSAALVLTPDVPLAKAVAMLPLCAIGLQNALGALAPPEVAVHLEWEGGIRLNGGRCGSFRMAASDNTPEVEPRWLVVGFFLPLLILGEGGDRPDETALFEEGCADVDPVRLLESWARHTLNWIARWEEGGNKPLHAEWRGLAHGIGEVIEVQGHSGVFLGIDEDFGMLLRDETSTRSLPLTLLLET